MQHVQLVILGDTEYMSRYYTERFHLITPLGLYRICMEKQFTTLGICQEKARNKCVTRSEHELSDLNRTYMGVFHIVSNTLHPIWNNFELMTTTDWEVPGHLILNNSGLP